MWWLAIGPGLIALMGVIYWRRHRDDETIDLRNSAERRRAAAEWMSEGEVEEAEDMLRAAVSCLRGWEVAVARGDLATFLAACQRMPEAIAELRRACNMAPSTSHEAAEALELRVTLADFLRGEGQVDEAEKVLVHAGEWSSEPLLRALASEAHALHFIACEEWERAASPLEAALGVLREHAHDRAASCQVSIALVRFHLGHAPAWSELRELDDDLQRAAIVNYLDRCAEWGDACLRATARELCEALPDTEDWLWARAQLEEIGSDDALDAEST